ncbi:MAG: ribonucleotide reductase subunit R1E [Streptococcus sp.]
MHKDKEALRAFFLENVKPNSMAFNSITDKINYLIENDYIESEFIGKYEPAFIEKLSANSFSKIPLPIFHGSLQVLPTICPQNKRWRVLPRKY